MVFFSAALNQLPLKFGHAPGSQTANSCGEPGNFEKTLERLKTNMLNKMRTGKLILENSYIIETK